MVKTPTVGWGKNTNRGEFEEILLEINATLLLIKCSIYPEDINIINLFAPNNIAPKGCRA